LRRNRSGKLGQSARREPFELRRTEWREVTANGRELMSGVANAASTEQRDHFRGGQPRRDAEGWDGVRRSA
jgi:hypothetical protein